MNEETEARGEEVSSENGAPEPPLETPPGRDLAETVPLVEALLFATSKPVAIEKLAEAGDLAREDVERALGELEQFFQDARRGVRIEKVAGGVRLVSRPEFDYPIRRLLGLDGKNKLSMAGLETLAIIAYRQPVTAPEIAEIRGVSSASSLRTLLDRKLITTAGRKEVVGTPFLYKTTKEFLIHFGLKAPSDLPRPEELDSLYGIEPAHPSEPEQTELFPEEEGGSEVTAETDVLSDPAATVGESEQEEASTASQKGRL